MAPPGNDGPSEGHEGGRLDAPAVASRADRLTPPHSGLLGPANRSEHQAAALVPAGGEDGGGFLRPAGWAGAVRRNVSPLPPGSAGASGEGEAAKEGGEEAAAGRGAAAAGASGPGGVAGLGGLGLGGVSQEFIQMKSLANVSVQEVMRQLLGVPAEEPAGAAAPPAAVPSDVKVQL